MVWQKNKKHVKNDNEIKKKKKSNEKKMKIKLSKMSKNSTNKI